jgi:molybdenum cofactor cytidylyltransferase
MIVAVVPAAGQSRRMGACKQLLPFAGTTVIGHIVDELLRSRVSEVRVVVGHQAEQMREELRSRNVRIVVNPQYEQSDMLASIRCGIAELPPECSSVLVAVGDQPALRAELVNAMIGCFETAGRGIVVPACAGRRGHPVLIAATYRDEIMTGYDQLGLRGLLAAHAGDIHELPISASEALSDMDYPEDYRREVDRHCGAVDYDAGTCRRESSENAD